MKILSIQSHVAYGYVGNKAAVFSLQRMGHEVVVINTVQFSNHTGYGKWTGEIFSEAHINDLINGLEKLDVLSSIDAVLSGYLGDAAIGEVILDVVSKIKAFNKDVVYCCDAVMGDIDRGFYVKPGIFEFFKEKALKFANIITPNQFEAEALSGMKIETLDDAKKAINVIANISNAMCIIITSLIVKEIKNNQISTLLYTDGDFFLITTPYIDFNIPPNGSGDMFSALFLGQYLKTKDPLNALDYTVNSVYTILNITKDKSRRELDLITAQEHIASPAIKYRYLKC